ncbi:MAG TPA: ankyrin repeat domain-containing protein [Streptosporangiaceae bacterium]|nr:ankyrin repeat domain-containing protein [Streptosporangiaceae bacterium]
MSVLPANPHLEHLRREARDLLRAARAGDPDAAGRISAVSDRLILASAQLAVARDYGFDSWAQLKIEVQARVEELAKVAAEFCRESMRGYRDKAILMLAARPELATYSLATEIILGEADLVRPALAADPSLVTRQDPQTGWYALHAACASRWHQLDPARADGLLAIAAMLLDAGADPKGPPVGQWTPLRCAVAGACNQAIVRLLLERGAVPADHDLYLAGFAGDDHECLRLLLAAAGNVGEIAAEALAAPISLDDTEGVRLLLEAGAEPGKFVADSDRIAPVVHEAVRAGCGPALIEQLAVHGADLDAVGPDDRSAYALAVSLGRSDLAELLVRHGARAEVSGGDALLAALLAVDRAVVDELLARQPGLPAELTEEQRGAGLTRAAETGRADAIDLMLDLGFPIETRGGDHGAAALHTAAYSGSANVVRLLIERGANVEARDGNWDSTALVWANIGSSEKPDTNPDPDWKAVVQALLDAGASTEGIELTDDDDHPPSAEVADLRR